MLQAVPARWFELLVPRRAVARTLEALAATGRVELDRGAGAEGVLSFPRLAEPLATRAELLRRYGQYWPPPKTGRVTRDRLLEQVLDEALKRLQGWRREADPRIRRIEETRRERGELQCLEAMCRAARGEHDLDFGRIAAAAPEMAAALFVLPPESETPPPAERVLYRRFDSTAGAWLLTLGRDADLSELARSLEGRRARALRLPAWLDGTPAGAGAQVRRRLAAAERLLRREQAAIERLNTRYQVAEALGNLERVAWMAQHLEGVGASDYMAWISGWTSDPDGASLNRALAEAGIPAALDFPPAPGDRVAPTLSINPPWAKPFELFARLVGTPGRYEADPSVLVAVIAPLLFGYMFGDVGHGAVVLVLGIWLRRRWPATAVLITGGILSIGAGFLYGSVFGREDLIEAVWLHPVAEPLPVLVVPLLGGAVLIFLSMLLNALEYRWSGRFSEWLRTESGLALALGFGIASVWHPVLLAPAAAALVWQFAGTAWEYRRLGAPALGRSFAELAEGLLRLAVNTLSFIRVGAFALAHAGLALAVISLADDAGHPVTRMSIMVIGNALIIVIEGLVVSIQTTRLVLFEFFIRFLRAGGRAFQPLAPPQLNHKPRSNHVH